MSNFRNILIVDDDSSVTQALKLNLEHIGYRCETSNSGGQALELLGQKPFDILLVDYQIPGVNGLELVRLCSRRFPQLISVLMTGFGSEDLALNAILNGATDYISKPFDGSDLTLLLKKLSARQTKAAQAGKPNKPAATSNTEPVVASSSMQAIFETVDRLAGFNTTVLIQGESGTGKELIARTLHTKSARGSGPFVAINCGAIPENLIESELFGHKKGAFTDALRDKPGLFEEASGGTVFLDEIGELPLNLQVKLLRVLQEQQIQPIGDEKPRKIDVRVVAATLRNLEQDVQQGRFREDLLFRLNVITIDLPPLRDRPEDIPVLAKHFLQKINARLHTAVSAIEPEAMSKLISHHWKGNVRELENCIERAIVLCDGGTITISNLPPALQNGDNASSTLLIDSDNLSIKQHTEKIERQLITRALDKTHGNRTKAAKLLELSHRALLYKLKEYDLVDYAKEK